MELTIPLLKNKFKTYNKLYFNNELPTPKFKLIKSYRTLGYFSCKKIIGKRKLKGQMLEMSSYYDWNENDLRDVLIHEMIHYYLGYKHIDNNLTHGKDFLNMANDFNQKYQMNISERIDISKFHKLKNAPKISWFLVRLFP